METKEQNEEIVEYDLFLHEGKPMLCREKKVPFTGRVDSPDMAVKIFEAVFNLSKRAEEHFVMLALDAKGSVLGAFEISHGTVDKTVLSPREIMVRALLCGAVRMIVAHNHPSGDVTPSEEDVITSTRVKKVGELLCIPVVDSLIIGKRGTYYSLGKDW